jgi:tetratricopeptide (TPR) repeat protein/predicted Ser/Thr protein kinase
MPLSLGDELGPYTILAPIGAGGMGEVWKARDTRLDRIVAIKQLKGHRPARFEHEARAIAALNHPHICQIYDIGPDYLVMEYIDGKPLNGLFPIDESIRLITQIATALEEAHAHGILHRDIKPNNIVLTNKGEAKLLDFGLAKLTTEDSDATQTMEGKLIGTPAYMSPEQARGQPVDARSDLFSLGAVLYECLTGRRAFPGTSSVGTLLEVVSHEPPAPSSITPGIPPRLDAVIRRLLAKDREARYASATLLIVDLKDCATIADQQNLPRRVMLASAVVLTLVLLGTAAWWINRSQGRASKQEARQVVVLPFENLDGQAETAAFGDGLAEVVTSLLTRRGVLPDRLWVVPASDVRRFGVKTVADAGRMFKASVAIGGSVQHTLVGAGWVITISASDASPLHLLGSREIRLQAADAGKMEGRLIAALVDLLDPQSRPQPLTAEPNPASYSRFVLARGYLRQYDKEDNINLAVSELESITKSTPNYAPAQVALAEAYFRMYFSSKKAEWLAKADLAVTRASEIDASDPDIPLMRGRILRATGQTDEAIRELKMALARDPGNLAALVQLAGAYESAKQVAQAEATYQEAIRLRPSFFLAHSNLGIFYMSQGKWAQAEEPLTIVTKLAPEYADGYTNLGSLLYEMGRLDAAQGLFTRSIELKPSATAFSNRCAVEFDKKTMEAAALDCRRAVDLRPASAIAWGNLGDTLIELGNRDEAMKAYLRGLEAGNKLLAINPTSPDLLASMAKFAAKTGQKQLAIDLAEKAVNQGTGVRTLYNAGKAFGLAGRCARSVDLLKQAFDKGFPREEARRDPDLPRLRAAPLACAVPPF